MEENKRELLPDIQRTIIMEAPIQKVWKAIATSLEKDKTQFTLVHSGWEVQFAMLREKMYEGWGYLTEDLRQKLGDKNGGYVS